jgi:hypothetical protein
MTNPNHGGLRTKGAVHVLAAVTSCLALAGPATGAVAAAPEVAPQVGVSLLSKSAGKVHRSGRLLVQISSTAKVDDVNLTATTGGATIATALDLSLSAGAQYQPMKLTGKARQKLERRGKATILLTAVIPQGTTATATGRLK